MYTYMLLMPPIAQRVRGHYWTAEVLMGFLLLALTFTLQISLTYIGGRNILSNQADFYRRLIQDADFYEEAVELGPLAEDLTEGEIPSSGHENEDDRPPHFFLRGKKDSAHTQLRAASNLGEAPPSYSFIGARNCSYANSLEHGGALCARQKDSGRLDCAPRTLRLIDSWQQLDTNDDGRWSIQEAQDDAGDLGCSVGVPLEDVFRAVCRGIAADVQAAKDQGLQPPELPNAVMKRRSIPKSYFKWWSDLVQACVYTVHSSCSTMMLLGHFDDFHREQRGSLKEMHFDAALTYCNALLKEGGICDAALPGAYTMYRASHSEMCGMPRETPSGERFQNPYSSDEHDVLQVNTVQFSTIDVWESSRTIRFVLFLFLVLVLWFVNMLQELKDILRLADFLIHFPVENTATSLLTPQVSKQLIESAQLGLTRMGINSESVQSAHRSISEKSLHSISQNNFSFYSAGLSTDQLVNLHIDVIDRPHQWLCIFIVFARAFLLIYIGVAGTVFITTQRTYMDLLLNSLVIAFIFELDECVYRYLVPDATKIILGKLEPVLFPSTMAREYWSVFMSKFTWAITLVPVLAGSVIWMFQVSTVAPVIAALNCACLKIGEKCMDHYIAVNAADAYWDHLAGLVG
jgi:hypothetical protein